MLADLWMNKSRTRFALIQRNMALRMRRLSLDGAVGLELLVNPFAGSSAFHSGCARKPTQQKLFLKRKMYGIYGIVFRSQKSRREMFQLQMHWVLRVIYVKICVSSLS